MIENQTNKGNRLGPLLSSPLDARSCWAPLRLAALAYATPNTNVPPVGDFYRTEVTLTSEKQAQVAVKRLKRMFHGRKVFQNPKDHEVIARLIRYVAPPDAIILDSFAGSGTTGHAVMELNKSDGGKRRCVLVELDPTIAETVTSKRLAHAVDELRSTGESQTGGGAAGWRSPRPDGLSLLPSGSDAA